MSTINPADFRFDGSKKFTLADQPTRIEPLYADKKEYKQAYIWSKILHSYNPEDTTITEKGLDSYAKASGLDREFLDKVASSTLNKITAGRFTSPHT